MRYFEKLVAYEQETCDLNPVFWTFTGRWLFNVRTCSPSLSPYFSFTLSSLSLDLCEN